MIRTIGGMVLVFVAMAVAGPQAGAQKLSDFDSKALYIASCAPCHGPTGMGGGPVAAALNRPLPMIATLAKRNGGTFPTDHVYQVIDGRKEVAAHGSRIMPVWGSVFGATHYGGGREHSTKVMIDALIEHIKQLQIE